MALGSRGCWRPGFGVLAHGTTWPRGLWVPGRRRTCSALNVTGGFCRGSPAASSIGAAVVVHQNRSRQDGGCALVPWRLELSGRCGGGEGRIRGGGSWGGGSAVVPEPRGEPTGGPGGVLVGLEVVVVVVTEVRVRGCGGERGGVVLEGGVAEQVIGLLGEGGVHVALPPHGSHHVDQ